jgi:hypothetical protein
MKDTCSSSRVTVLLSLHFRYNQNITTYKPCLNRSADHPSLCDSENIHAMCETSFYDQLNLHRDLPLRICLRKEPLYHEPKGRRGRDSLDRKLAAWMYTKCDLCLFRG